MRKGGDDANNKFDKLDKYAQALNSAWEEFWWADPLNTGKKTFPLVVVWTVRPESIPEMEWIRVIPIGEPILQKFSKVPKKSRSHLPCEPSKIRG